LTQAAAGTSIFAVAGAIAQLLPKLTQAILGTAGVVAGGISEWLVGARRRGRR
jgi:hypothetical protein